MFNLISKITPPHVAFRIIGKNHNSCNVSGGAHLCASRLFLCLLVVLFAGAIVWCGFHDTRHNSIVWCKNIPSLYVPIFYNADSLDHYIYVAYHEEDPEALAIAGTAAYNLRVFDKQALDSLPAVELEDADMMLLGAAWKGYAPAFTVIQYLDQLDLWRHSIPDNEPTDFPDQPAKSDPDYVQMKVRK